MIDDIKWQEQENSSVKGTITVSGEETQKHYNSVLSKYAKKAQIPGFRKGKVPHDVLVRKFGVMINQEAATEVIEAGLQNALDNNRKKKPVSQPTLEDFPDLEPGQPYVFNVTFDVFPEITLGDYKSVEIELPQVRINKADIDKELEAIRDRNAVYLDKEDGLIAKDSVVTIDYCEIDENDQVVEATVRNGFVFTVGGDQHPYKIDDEIQGMKVGDEKVISKTFDKDAEGPMAGRTVRINVKIVAVKEKQLPDLDDELAQDVSEDLKTLDDLKNKVKDDLKKRLEDQKTSHKINAITDKLVEICSIDIPKSMVDSDLEYSWQNYCQQSGLPEDMVLKILESGGNTKDNILNEWREQSTRSTKARLIYNKIIEEEKIAVSDEEIIQSIAERAQKNNISPEELEKKFGGIRFRDYLKEEMTQKKLFDFLIDCADVKKGRTQDFSDFIGQS